eukprot:scaffold473_cov132-Cylindrotheca_fusiformis.AAC.15
MAEETCDATTNATCSSTKQLVEGGVCIPPQQSSKSIYSQGGTAQAYKPNAPLSSTVCQPETAMKYKYKTASWHLSRKISAKGTAPQLDVTLQFQSCTFALEAKEEGQDCRCYSMEDAAIPSNVVEIWQTRPDGQYSSLRNGNECRAQVPVDEQGQVRFQTVAPGSTGIMGGLGPSGFEWGPYGPPVIHILVQVAGHEPLLLDLPVLPRRKGLTQQHFSLGDWRGQGWMKMKPQQSVVVLRSWEPNVEENRISIVYEISLQQQQQRSSSGQEGGVEFCESFIYGFPKSFYLEPISVCSPSTLNFFAL